MADSGERHVWIRWERDERGGSYVCGDEDGEFARTDQVALLIPYVELLVLGPGTLREGGLRPAEYFRQIPAAEGEAGR